MPVEPLTRTRSPVVIRCGCCRRADDGGKAELTGDDRRVGRNAPGIGNEPTDPREQDDPRRVRHRQTRISPLPHFVELVERSDETGGALDHSRRAPPARGSGLPARAAHGGTSPGSPRGCSRGTRAGTPWRCRSTRAAERRSCVRARPDGRRRVTWRRRRRASREHAELVVAQEHHVLGIIEHVGLDEASTDRDEDEPHIGVRGLVDVEVVVRRKRVHAQRELESLLEPVPALPLGNILEKLAPGRLEVVRDRGELVGKS